MSKMRVFELARELKVDTKAVIEILKKHHINVKNNMSGVDEAGRLRRAVTVEDKDGRVLYH